MQQLQICLQDTDGNIYKIGDKVTIKHKYTINNCYIVNINQQNITIIKYIQPRTIQLSDIKAIVKI